MLIYVFSPTRFINIIEGAETLLGKSVLFGFQSFIKLFQHDLLVDSGPMFTVFFDITANISSLALKYNFVDQLIGDFISGYYEFISKRLSARITAPLVGISYCYRNRSRIIL